MVAVVAHRGASAAFPEHTLAAYRKAVDDGADGLECDVRLSVDGHLVCIHDRSVDRTSSGRGAVSRMTLTQLRELEFASWKGRYDVADRDLFGVLTLERLLELVVDSGRRVEVAVETKHPNSYGGLVERAVVDLLDRFGLNGPRAGAAAPVRVMSFSAAALRRVAELAPRVPTVHLTDRVPMPRRARLVPPGVTTTGPSVRLLRADPTYVERAHDRGLGVHVWTVDEPADVHRVVALGVDAVITNRPAEVLDLLGRRRDDDSPGS